LWFDVDNETIEDLVEVLLSFLKARAEEYEVDEGMTARTQNTICTEEYAQFMFNLLVIPKEEWQKHKENFELIVNLSFKVMASSPKKKFMAFMNNYLKIAETNLHVAMFPLKSDGFS
jgi:hypothetical protein